MSTNSNHLIATNNAPDLKMSKEEAERVAKLLAPLNASGASINLSGKRIGDAGAIALAKTLETNKTLSNINLTDNQIGDAGAKALAKALGTNMTLSSINLSGNRISEAGAKALAEVLKTNMTLSSIDLYINQISDAGAIALAKALETNKTLSSINLGLNQIGNAGAKALTKVLETNMTLSSIYLGNNQISNAGAKALAKVLETNMTLSSIDLYSNQIGNEGAIALAKTLETNMTLSSMNLSGNQISDAGAKALAKALETNMTLSSIDLFSNQIGNEGAIALAKALETNMTLSSMSLDNNQIGDAGAIALAKTLETNMTLSSMSLSGNQIGDAGAKALAKALETNKTLSNIDLGDNQLGAVSAKALAKALETNKTLSNINLTDNQIGDAGAIALAKTLETNMTLSSMSLDNNQIGDAGAIADANLAEIKKHIEDNSALRKILAAAKQFAIKTPAGASHANPNAATHPGVNASSFNTAAAGSSSNDTKSQHEMKNLKTAAETTKARFDRLSLLFTKLNKELDELSAKNCPPNKINQIKAIVSLTFTSLPDADWAYYQKEDNPSVSFNARIKLLRPLCLLPIEAALKQEALSILSHLYQQIKDDPSAIVCARLAGNQYLRDKNIDISHLSLARYLDRHHQDIFEDFEEVYSAALKCKEYQEKMEKLELMYQELSSQFNLQRPLKQVMAPSCAANKKLSEATEIITMFNTSLRSSTAASHFTGTATTAAASSFLPMAQQPQTAAPKSSTEHVMTAAGSATATTALFSAQSKKIS